MSQITVSFNGLEEMMEYAQELLAFAGGAATGKGGEPGSYGQQIAPHFPAANTGQIAPPPAQLAVAPQPPVQQTVPQQPPMQQTAPQQTAPQQTAPQQQAPIQTTSPSYKMEDLSGAAMQLMDKGMQAQLQQLLAGYGVDSLPSLPPEQYGAFATALRGLGAQI